jgi:hypothetical protein
MLKGIPKTQRTETNFAKKKQKGKRKRSRAFSSFFLPPPSVAVR